MVTWVMFADLVTGRHFYAVNTHLDNMSENARSHGAHSSRSGWPGSTRCDRADRRLQTARRSPATRSTACWRPGRLPGRLDGRASAGRRTRRSTTTRRWCGGIRADWILTTPGVTTLATLMNTYREKGQYPSDHLPIESRLRLP
jgi:endonuclease/exonuclease/phosphatase family metal-dependent hydrolase